VWPVAQQPAVFHRGRFTLLAIRDDDRLHAATSGVAHGAQLGPQGERGTATPQQPGQVDLLQQRVGVGQWPVAAGLYIVGQLLGLDLGWAQ
jgi:hypothetical protein